MSLVGLWSVLHVRGYFKTYLGFSVHFVQSTKFIVVMCFLVGYREHIVMPYYSTILSLTRAMEVFMLDTCKARKCHTCKALIEE